jgi:GT2 family glycosyltransferase
MTIAIIMACHNRRELTLKTLRLLYGQSGLNDLFKIDVFLLDDGSSDGTSHAVSQKFPDVNIIKGAGNLYWNRGMHVAWKAAIGSKKIFKCYLWLNDDTFLFKDGLKMMLKAADETNFSSIICASICSPHDKHKLTYGGYTLNSFLTTENYPKGKIEVADIINGNCVLIPYSVCYKVGNLDWTFTHAIGDFDYSLRAKNLGVLSYSTGTFIGTCSNDFSLPKWVNPKLPLAERIKNLYSPLGNAEPFTFFIFQKRHFGVLRAIKSFITTHIRLIFPQLWTK